MEEEFKYIVRISGTDVDGKKKVPYGLTSIKGIGSRVAKVVCRLAKVDPNKKAGYLTDEEAGKLEDVVKQVDKNNVPEWLMNRRRDPSSGEDHHLISSELIMSLRDDVNRLKKIRSYRGIRHERGLPVRGQRTRSCFRKGTAVGVSRKKVIQAGKDRKKEGK